MQIPYLLAISATLNANGTGTLQYTVPPNEKLMVDELYFVSTGAFSITDIRVSGGHVITNAGANNPIPSTMLGLSSNENNTLQKLKLPITLNGGQVLYIDLLDTSGAGNTVRFVGNSVREI